MIFDQPITNRSREWLREMADWETENCDDPYPALLLSPAPPPLVAPAAAKAHTTPAAANACAVQRARPLADREALGEVNAPLAAYALAVMGLGEACE